MGGPGASVLTRNPLTGQQRGNLDAWIQSITLIYDSKDSSGYSFWLKEDLFPETVSKCLFYLSRDPWDTAEENEHQQLINHLGYIPQRVISMSSGCNQDSDHRTLGLLILQLAEKYHGLINMEGAILPPIQQPPISKDFFKEQSAKAEERKAYLHAEFKALEATLPPGKTLQDLFRERHSDPDSPLIKIETGMVEKFGPVLPSRIKPTFEEISSYVQGMPGKVYEIYYETANKTQWVYHIVDATFLRAWLKHPRFHMIK